MHVITLDDVAALIFGDIARDVIKAVVSKLLSKGTLTDPSRFRDAVTALGPNFTVDKGLSNQKILELRAQMRITSGEDVKSFMAPIGPFGTSSDGQWYVSPERARLQQLATALRKDTMAEYAEGH